MRSPILSLVALAAVLATHGSARAAEPEKDTRGPALRGLTGVRYILAPGLLGSPEPILTSNGFDTGNLIFGLDDHLGYGLPVGPVVLSLGVSVPFYFINTNFTLGTAADVQAHLPFGMFSPYLRVGGGAAFFTGGVSSMGKDKSVTISEVGGLFRASGGLLVHPVEQLGFGVEVGWVHMGSFDMLQTVFPFTLRL